MAPSLLIRDCVKIERENRGLRRWRGSRKSICEIRVIRGSEEKLLMAGRHHQHAFSRARVHDIFSVRSDSAPKDSSVSISDGRRGALHFLSALTLGIGVRRFQLVLPDRGRPIDGINHVVLSIFPRRGRTNVDGRRGSRERLHISLHHVAPTGLRVADGSDRVVHRPRRRDVRNAQGRLVRARRECLCFGPRACPRFHSRCEETV